MGLEKDAIVEGVITGIAKFGAFVDLPEGLKGLVHISEISKEYVTDINQHVKIGEKVKIKVLGETKPGKYDLSMKRVEGFVSPVAPYRPPEGIPTFVPKRKMDDSFESKITRFLKQSDEKQNDLKRQMQSKHEGKKKKTFK